MNIKESIELLKTRMEQKNLLFISGNVYDSYLLEGYKPNVMPEKKLYSLKDIIAEYSSNVLGYRTVEYFRPLKGSKNLMSEDSQWNNKTFSNHLGSIIAEIEDDKKESDNNKPERKVYILDVADIYLDHENKGESSLIGMMSHMISVFLAKEKDDAKNITSMGSEGDNSKIIFVMRDIGGVSNVLTSNNLESESINISKPDIDERANFIKTFASRFGTINTSELRNSENAILKDAAASTDGMNFREILQLGRITQNDLSFKELLNKSKFNDEKSQWEKLPWSDVKDVEIELKKSVIGQDEAIKEVARTLKTSLLGLTGSLNGSQSKKPKGAQHHRFLGRVVRFIDQREINLYCCANKVVSRTLSITKSSFW